jgi:hypothetical protein
MDTREGERPPKKRKLALVVSLMVLVALGIATLVANQRSVRAAVWTWRASWNESWSSESETLGEADDSETELGYHCERDWEDFVVEFSVEPRRGRVWFLGHLKRDGPGFRVDGEIQADQLPLELTPARAAKVQVRSFEGVWEISIDGGRWREVTPVVARGGPAGGFGYLVEPGGACEVKDVRLKDLSTSE